MHKTHLLFSTSSLRPALLVLGLVLITGPACAGFQWIAPPTPEQDMGTIPAPVDQASRAAGGLDTLPPAQIIEGKPAPQMPVVIPSTSTLPSAPSASKAAPQIVEGFADKVPLSVALHQILPSGTGFSVAQDVDLGTLVSWQGGASWQQVMKDMLAPSSLTFKEEGGLVHIIHAQPSAASAKPSGMPPVQASAPTPLLAPLPPAQRELPAMTVPDRNMPSGQGGVLSVPSSSAPVAAVPVRAPTPAVPVQPMAAPLPLISSSSAPAATSTSPYAYDNAVSAWTANKGDTLQTILGDWCKRAGVELSWQAEYDYPLQASVSLSGSFEEAVRSLLAGFQEASPQPVGYLYNNQVAGQTVLVVQARGNSYNE